MWQIYRWYVLGGLLILVLVGGGLYVRGLVQNARDEAIAQETERSTRQLAAINTANQEKFEQFVQESQRQMQEMARQQAQLAQAAVVRAQVYQAQASQVRAATEPVDIIKQLRDYLQVTASSSVPGTITLPASEAQNLVLLTLENRKLKEDVADLEKRVALGEQRTSSIQMQLDQALVRISEQRALLVAWEKTSEKWKTAAKSSRWRRVAQVAVPVGLSFAAAYAGGQLAR